MKPGLAPGHAHELIARVDPHLTIRLGSDDAVVFSTPSMIALMERTARHALEPYLEPGEASVGTTVEVQHLAATPLGAQVHCSAKVTAVDGRKINFQVECHDSKDLIGRGTHQRAIINVPKFAQHLASKKSETAPMSLPTTHGTTVLNPTAHPLPTTLPGAQPVNPIQPNAGALPPTDLIKVQIDGPIACFELNRPRQLNSMDRAMALELQRLLGWLFGHPEIRVVVFSGAGTAFSAGDDVKELGQLPLPESETLNLTIAQNYAAFYQLPQILIAQINGPCFGGGMILAAACDIRMASRTATFGMPEINLGWPPSFGFHQLASVVGLPNATELCLSCRTFNADEALRLGFVHEIQAPNLLGSKVDAFVRTLLARAPAATRALKAILYAPHHTPIAASDEVNNRLYLPSLGSPAAQEGIAAFREKRAPKFPPA